MAPRPKPDKLSYHLSHRAATVESMTRVKRSISLPGELAEQIEAAAAAEGTSVSAWLAQSAAHRLRMEAGRRALVEWEAEHGALTPDELAEGQARAAALLGLGALGKRPA